METEPRSRYKLVGVVAVMVVAVLAVMAYILWFAPRPAVEVPAAFVEAAGFPLYVPSSLPEGYTVDEKSFESSQGTIIFYAKNQNGEKIVFSEQAKPSGYDFESFHGKVMKESKTVLGATSTSWVGKSEGNTWLLSVPTDKTWLLVSSQTSTGQTDLEYVARQLEKQ